jgi:hypothetical protein
MAHPQLPRVRHHSQRPPVEGGGERRARESRLLLQLRERRRGEAKPRNRNTARCHDAAQ